MDSGSLGKTSPSQEAAVFVQLLPCPELPSRSSSFVVISGHYFRFGVFGMKQIPSLVTVTSLLLQPSDIPLRRCRFLGVCKFRPVLPRGDFSAPGNRPLDPFAVSCVQLPRAACWQLSRMRGSAMGVGMLRRAVQPPPPPPPPPGFTGSIRPSTSFLLLPSLGLSEDLEPALHRKLCSEAQG